MARWVLVSTFVVVAFGACSDAHVNLPPELEPFGITVAEDDEATLDVPAVDRDGGALAIVVIDGPSHGTATVTDRTLVYDPAPNYHGADALVLSISDGEETITGPVDIVVESVNDAPVGTADTLAAAEDTARIVDVSALLQNDSDIEGDALTITAVGGASSGTVALAGGNVTFTPTANYAGPGAFQYTLSDGTATATVAVSLAIGGANDAPVAVDDNATTNEDTPITLPTLAANDTDAEGNTRTVTAVGSAQNGSVVLNGGSPIFTPAANFSGNASFEYTVSDGVGGSDTGAVTITVNAVNDAPVAVDDDATTDEDTAIMLSTLASNDTDVEGNPRTVTAVGSAQNGSVVLNGGSPIFTPNANFGGTASFEYTVSDGAGGSDTGLVTITVTPVVDSVAISPAAIDLGSAPTTGILHVELDSPAPAGGVVVDLAATGSVAVPASVTVPAGATRVGFRVRSTAVIALGSATVTATLASGGPSANTTVNFISVISDPVIGDLVINEVNYDVMTTMGVAGDANCDGSPGSTNDEFIELTNASSHIVQLGGVSLWDAIAFAAGTPVFELPSMLLGPGESVVVFGGAIGTQTASPWCTNVGGGRIGDAIALAGATLNLNNAGDTVYVTLTNNNASTQFAALVLPAGTDESYTRSPDITGAFVKHSMASRAATDRDFSPGTQASGRPFAAANPP